jgi:hypothetical protein
VKLRITRLSRASVVIALAACVMGADTAPPVVIQLRVVEGDGAVYPIGSRATRGLAVQVIDETGKPVDAAAVSFQLPGDGPGGSFAGGGKTEIVTTKADGTAAVWGMQWNKTPGGFEIKVTASKGQARAGVAVTQYLRDSVKAAAGGEGTFTASHHSRTKWLIIAAAIGGGAAAGIGLRGSSKAAAPAPTTTPTSIGNPTILVGHP